MPTKRLLFCILWGVQVVEVADVVVEVIAAVVVVVAVVVVAVV